MIGGTRSYRQLVRFIQDFDSRDGGIVNHGLEGEIDLALGRWPDVAKRLGDDALAAGFLVYVEVFEQRFAVAIHMEDSAARPAATFKTRPEEKLREIQDHGVAA